MNFHYICFYNIILAAPLFPPHNKYVPVRPVKSIFSNSNWWSWRSPRVPCTWWRMIHAKPSWSRNGYHQGLHFKKSPLIRDIQFGLILCLRDARISPGLSYSLCDSSWWFILIIVLTDSFKWYKTFGWGMGGALWSRQKKLLRSPPYVYSTLSSCLDPPIRTLQKANSFFLLRN